MTTKESFNQTGGALPHEEADSLKTLSRDRTSECRCRCGPILATSLVLLACGLREGSAQESVVMFDRFLSGFASDCETSPALNGLTNDLFARYAYDGRVRLKSPVRVAEEVKKGFGRATAEDKKSYTHIRVPLQGTFRGIRAAAFEFDGGHDNDIFILTLVLNVPLNELERSMGDAIRQKSRQLVQAAREGRDEGHAPELKAVGTLQSELVCEYN